MRQTLLVVPALLLAAAGTGAAGCSADRESPERSAASGRATPTRAMITWVDAVCAADDDLQAKQGAVRVLAYSMVPRQPTRTEIVRLVAGARRDLQQSLTTFQKMDMGTVEGGDRLVAAYIAAVQDAVSAIKKLETTAKDSSVSHNVLLDVPGDLAGAITVAPAGTDLPTLRTRNAALDRAYRQADSCQHKHYRPARTSPKPTSTT
jgi:hypothetical protein